MIYILIHKYHDCYDWARLPLQGIQNNCFPVSHTILFSLICTMAGNKSKIKLRQN